MTVAAEIASRLSAKVSLMALQERGMRAAELVDSRVLSEEDNLEFAKLICGPEAGAQELMDLLKGQGHSPQS